MISSSASLTAGVMLRPGSGVVVIGNADELHFLAHAHLVGVADGSRLPVGLLETEHKVELDWQALILGRLLDLKTGAKPLLDLHISIVYVNLDKALRWTEPKGLDPFTAEADGFVVFDLTVGAILPLQIDVHVRRYDTSQLL